MASWEEIRRVSELAGPHLGVGLTIERSEFCTWRELFLSLSKIPDSATAEFLPEPEQESFGDFLVIAYRAQNAIIVGIPLEKMEEPDPPVYVSPNEDSPLWKMEFECASDWYCVVLLWSLVNNGRGVLGYSSKGAKAARKRIEGSSTSIAAFSHKVKIEFRSWGSSGMVCFAGKEVYAWAESESFWNTLSKSLEVKWDYCSSDDA